MPAIPCPTGARVGLFKGFDGAPLRFGLWDASRMPRRGTVCLFGGRGEFIEKYFETIADLQRRGFAVATMDFRGQGGSVRELSNPRKGYVRDFADHDGDVTRFMRDVVLPDCPPPYIALGHSTGGNILLRQATAQNSWFERMVISAPLLHFAPASIPLPERQVAFLMETLCLLGPRSALCPPARSTTTSSSTCPSRAMISPLTASASRAISMCCA